jgi:acyl phosphate:glycerol-3-phosphate acyltransferase
MTGVLIAAIVAYLLGSIPFGLVLTRLAGLGDIRRIGSGSIGATNVLRTGNKAVAALTLALDVAKGLAAVGLGWRWGFEAALVAAIAVCVGHMFPVWLHFRGGKGVATALGVLLALAWPVAIGAAVLWLAMAAIFQYSSLAALVAVGADRNHRRPGGGAASRQHPPAARRHREPHLVSQRVSRPGRARTRTARAPGLVAPQP